MRKSFIIMGLIALALTTSSCASQQQVFGYEMTCLGVGSEGSYLLKVYSYGKTYDKAVEQASTMLCTASCLRASWEATVALTNLQW